MIWKAFKAAPKRTMTTAAGVVLVGFSGFVFSERSLNNVREVDPRLQRVAECALQKTTVDFVVIDGRRTIEEHINNVRNGRSWIKRSKHVDGLALDFAAYVDGKVTYEPVHYASIAAAFYYCASELNTPITWGGEWRVQDLMHIELKGVDDVRT